MTDHLIRNNLRQKKKTKKKKKKNLWSLNRNKNYIILFYPPPPFHFRAFNIIYFIEKILWITILCFKMFCYAQNIR